jgi:quercetin dioxygenase-like cupin family protein
MHEAQVDDTPNGKVATTDGWFILNLSEISWETVPGGGTWCVFESPDAPSPRLGIGVHVLLPGETPGFYHAENEQEGFLVLSGECIAVVEGQERRLRAWDYLHCPPETAHITIGAGEEPCAILMVGTRSADHRIRYLVDAAAAAHGASVRFPTNSPAEAYAGRPTFTSTSAPPPFVS